MAVFVLLFLCYFDYDLINHNILIQNKYYQINDLIQDIIN